MKRKLLIMFLFFDFFLFSMNKQIFEFSLKKKKGKYILKDMKHKKKQRLKVKKKKMKKKTIVKKNRKLLNKKMVIGNIIQLGSSVALGVGTGIHQKKKKEKLFRELEKFKRIWKFKTETLEDINGQLTKTYDKLLAVNGRWQNWLDGTVEKLEDEERELTDDFEKEKEDLKTEMIEEEGNLKSTIIT